tara:strand:+ start:301 stop:858 length:558 start_codon:yes stop_codon:yes gene_type:complete
MKNIKLESFGVFGFGNPDERWFGFSDGNHWNGFETPLFTKETLIKIKDYWDKEFKKTKDTDIPILNIGKSVGMSLYRYDWFGDETCETIRPIKSDYGNLYRIVGLTWKRYDYIYLDGDIYFKEDNVDYLPECGWEVTKIQPDDGMVSLKLEDNDGEMYFENDKLKIWRDEILIYRTDIHITNLES